MTQTDNSSNTENKTGFGTGYSIEELQVVGEQLLAKVRELVHEGNVRRITIKQGNHTIVEIPLALGVASVLLAPVWAAVGVMGALLAQCTIEVVRADEPFFTDNKTDSESPAE